MASTSGSRARRAARYQRSKRANGSRPARRSRSGVGRARRLGEGTERGGTAANSSTPAAAPARADDLASGRGVERFDGLQGQANGEAAAHARLALEPDRAAVRDDDARGDRQA